MRISGLWYMPKKHTTDLPLKGNTLIGPGSIPWEIGNALSTMFKRRRLSIEEAKKGMLIFEGIPIRKIAAMSGIVELEALLESMTPEVQNGEYVFCSVQGNPSDYLHLKPLATFRESEGLTLILAAEAAEKEGLKFESRFKQITLTVHSSLDAVGLTASVSTKLASYGISANVVAAYYHDHIFVQSDKAQEALRALMR